MRSHWKILSKVVISSDVHFNSVTLAAVQRSDLRWGGEQENQSGGCTVIQVINGGDFNWSRELGKKWLESGGRANKICWIVRKCGVKTLRSWQKELSYSFRDTKIFKFQKSFHKTTSKWISFLNGYVSVTVIVGLMRTKCPKILEWASYFFSCVYFITSGRYWVITEFIFRAFCLYGTVIGSALVIVGEGGMRAGREGEWWLRVDEGC